jgi:uncharacterized repeat protein (TIGR01451 family)
MKRAYTSTLVVLASVCSWSEAGATTLPPNFQETPIFTGLIQPTVVKFATDGRVFVAEKRGVIKVFPNLQTNTPTVFADFRTNVHNFWDRGFLGMALHPDFPATPYVYVLYTLDQKPGGPIPSWGQPNTDSDGCPDPPGATASGCAVGGRLSRFEASGSVAAGPEQILLEGWCQQFPSHSIGSLMFGEDGALYVTGGDGASFNVVDYGQLGGTGGTPVNVCGDPPGGVGGSMTPPTAEGGALRSQSRERAAGGPVVLGGTVLRVSPSNGAALPDNPLFSSVDPNARRLVADGLRNPFRAAWRPGTGELWVGDVGWNTWEEINRLPNPTGEVRNFGWPCFEGVGHQGGYDGTNLTICENLYNTSGAVVDPYYTYNHGAKIVSGETCATGSSAIAGLAFHPSNGPYPPEYRGALFFTDYNRRCIWVMLPDGTGTPDSSNRQTFAAGLSGGAVHLETGPNGDLFYVDYDGGRIMRVQYFVANQPPTAVIAAAPSSGPAPLTVQFDGSGSSDPDGDALVYDWDLDGDGAFDDGVGVSPSFVYTNPGTYTARLRVTDTGGASATASTVVSADNAPPTATIVTPSAGLTWKVGDVISFSGGATDPQQGTLPASALTWTLILQHCPSNCHQHTLQQFVGVASGSFTAPDHEYPSYLELRLLATDAGGLTDNKSVSLYPQTVALTFGSVPSGLQLAVNGAQASAPFTRTVIVGSLNSVSAPSPQTLSGTSYAFSSWSDGGAQSHGIVAPAAPTTYTATYALAAVADLSVSMSAAPSPVTVNDLLTYTATVANLGPGAASAVSLAIALPSNATFVSSDPPAPTCTASSGTLTCGLGTLASGGSSVVSIVVRPLTSGVATAQSSVGAAVTDPNTANNNASATATVDPVPSVAVSDTSVIEGNSGTSPAVFAVTLSVASSRVVTVAWSTGTGGSAKAGSDYVAGSGTLTFAPGVRSLTFSVAIIGDTIREKNESFNVKLGTVTNATIADRTGAGTIVNDDN